MDAEEIVSIWEKQNELRLEKTVTEKVVILFPSFGTIAFSDRKYAKIKRMPILIEKLLILRNSLKDAGYVCKWLNQDFLLKMGIVGGGFGIGYINK